VHGAPDIVVEVLSPSNRSFDEVAKFRLFEAHGVPEYWIVDPAENAIRCFVLTNGAYLQVMNLEGQPLPSSVLQGLTIDPEALFRDSDA
jgi:Uma2 family endonuclease